MKKILLLFFACCLLNLSINAQSDTTRIEILLRPNEIRPIVIPMDSMGLAILDVRQENLLDPSNVIKVIGYDAIMQRKWEKSISHNRRLSLRLHEFQQGKLFLIFGSQSREEVEFYVINPISGNVEKHNFNYLDNLLIEDFTVIENNIYILGTLKRLPVLLEFDLTTNKVEPFPMAINAKSVVVLDVFKSGFSQVTATVSMQVNKRKQILAKTFDTTTKQSEEFVVRPSEEYDLFNGKMTVLTENDKLVIGIYGYRNRTGSQGLYVGGYVGSREVIKKYHRFTDMNNFFAFLSDREQKRMKEKVSKKAQKGRDLKLRYRLLLHEAIIFNDQYIMVGEAYYPTYRTKRYKRYRPRGYYYDTRRVFDGYKFTHAVVAAIDKRGDLAWDHSFKINDTKTFQLKERVKILTSTKKLTLIYNLKGNIHQLQIENGKILHDEKSVELETKFHSDQVKNSDLGQAEYWYDSYFLAWGYQKIKNSEGESSTNQRNIFYINKLSY